MTRIPTAEEITANWGERCQDYGEGCPCCEIWAMHDEIERLRKALEAIRDGYGPNHLSKYARDVARAALDAIKEG